MIAAKTWIAFINSPEGSVFRMHPGDVIAVIDHLSTHSPPGWREKDKERDPVGWALEWGRFDTPHKPRDRDWADLVRFSIERCHNGYIVFDRMLIGDPKVPEGHPEITRRGWSRTFPELVEVPDAE